METQGKRENKSKTKKFKSYYVVWKQKMKATIRNHTQRFKSYYVVWKL